MRRMPETFLHSNGGGRILGIEAAVGSDCFIDRDSVIEGASFISNGSRIIKSAIKDSHVSFANITESAVMRSHITGALVRGSGLERVVVRGTRSRQATVQNCLLSNQAVIEGCKIRGVEVSAPILIHNDWNRTPRHHLLIPCNGVQMVISECSEGGIRGHCGCECRPYAEWIQKKELLRKIFVRRGWASESIDVINDLFQEWRRSIRLVA